MARARKSSTDVGVGEVADLRPVGAGQATDHRGQLGRPLAPLPAGSGSSSGTDRAERFGPAALVDEGLRGADDLERVRLALLARGAPGGDAVPAEDHADRLGVGRA